MGEKGVLKPSECELLPDGAGVVNFDSAGTPAGKSVVPAPDYYSENRQANFDSDDCGGPPTVVRKS